MRRGSEGVHHDGSVTDRQALPTTSPSVRARFPVARHGDLRQAARLSRQRRVGAEAAGGDRSHGACLWSTNMPMSIAACTSSPMRPPRLTRARARRCGPSSTRRPPTRSSSRARRPRRSTSSPTRFGRLLDIGDGDEIVLSIMEHHSNIVPWHFLRERAGAVIKWAPVRDDGSFDLDAFEKLLTPRTKIVAITHMSNVLGTVTPLKEIVAHRACPRHPRAGRRQPGRGASRRRRGGPRRRLLRASPATRCTARRASASLYGKRKWLELMPPFKVAAR